jgi:hypothetical protein
MKERRSWHCDRCDAATEKTAFSTLNYQGRVIDLCPHCARALEGFLDGNGAPDIAAVPSHLVTTPFLLGDDHES